MSQSISRDIPDFILVFPAGPVLVEVKPVFVFDDPIVYNTQAKIIASEWETKNVTKALILGASYCWHNEDYWAPAIGKTLQNMQVSWELKDGVEPSWAPALWHYCRKCEKASFHHSEGNWACPVSGCYDGDHYLGSIEHHANLEYFWNCSNPRWMPAAK